ncbi:hypothetical protein SASPL_124586 [Salvia splendens]|uniref:Maternal effect embryo arrest 59 n=1 Tax=Salvia splendens TaxID=180675 RepID=A0A8X8ZNH8_SALSN|nr:uncharacterized protein LOC121746505 [Salvia splendens]KAG6411932.1 hypothetical protein SASPL_124586 [Salvia splendens]
MEYVRPNRSDVHLSGEEAAKVEAAVRERFDEAAPKRHTKPQRSDHSAVYTDALSSDDGVIAEYAQFQLLEKDTEKLDYSGGKPDEEFTETEYYKDLNCVDKQHHTTGTGFIKMENTNEKDFSIAGETTTECHASSKGNPATNDWIPSPSTEVDFTSDKPSRSDC